MSASHCQLVLEALADGEWHSTADLYRRCGGMILHSRISDLRKRGKRDGFTIEHRHVGGQGASAHEYRYVLAEPCSVTAPLGPDARAPYCWSCGPTHVNPEPLAEPAPRVAESPAAVVADERGQMSMLTSSQVDADTERYGHVAAWR
jgi:hypothetical protein